MAGGKNQDYKLAIKIAGIIENSFGAAINAAQKSLSALGNAAAKAMQIGAAAVGAATGAVTAFAKSSVDTGMQFDESMSQIAATMGYSIGELHDPTSEASQNFEQLRDFALDMGSKTAFSASQAADALNYMALAGYDAEKSMNMLPKVLNLAAAGGIELARASDMVTDAQSALGLTMQQTETLVDQMARASSKSNTSIEQLGDAILTVGGTAKNLAGGTTELSTALGILADNGVKGSEGGTALRNMILSLSAPTDTAAKAMAKLGLEAFDQQGNLRPLNETFADLNKALSNLTQEQQTQALNAIFNKTDLKSVNALLANCGERFDELSGYIDNAAGAAENMANTQLDNLAGDITLFQSALEGAKITVSDELTPTLRQFVQFGSNAIGKLTDAFKEDGLNGAMDALGGILGEGLDMVIEYIPVAIDAGMQLVGALGKGIIDNLPKITDTAVEAAVMFAEGIAAALPSVMNEIADFIDGIANGISKALPKLLPMLKKAVPSFVNGIGNIISSVASGISQTLPDILSLVFEAVTETFNTVTNGLANIDFTGIKDFIRRISASIETYIPGIVSAITNLTIQILTVLTDPGTLSLILEAALNIMLSLAVGLVQAIPELVTHIPEIIAAIVSAFGNAAKTILDIGVNIVKGIWDGIASMANWIGEQISGFFGGIVDGVKGFLGIQSPSKVFAGIGTNMALGIGEGFGNSIDGVAKGIENSLPESVDLPDITAPAIATGEPFAAAYSAAPIIGTVKPPAIQDAFYKVIPETMTAPATAAPNAIQNLADISGSGALNPSEPVHVIIQSISSEAMKAFSELDNVTENITNASNSFIENSTAINPDTYSTAVNVNALASEIAAKAEPYPKVKPANARPPLPIGGAAAESANIPIVSKVAEIANTSENANITSVLNQTENGKNSSSILSLNRLPTFINSPGAAQASDLPALAGGGIAVGPTVAQIGEGGEPEVVIPVSKLQSLLQSSVATNTTSIGGQLNAVTNNEAFSSTGINNQMLNNSGAGTVSREPAIPADAWLQPQDSGFASLSGIISVLTEQTEAAEAGAAEPFSISEILGEINRDAKETDGEQPLQIVYSPTNHYHFESSAPGREEIAAAEGMSQAEFENRIMQYEKKKRRQNFREYG